MEAYGRQILSEKRREPILLARQPLQPANSAGSWRQLVRGWGLRRLAGARYRQTRIVCRARPNGSGRRDAACVATRGATTGTRRAATPATASWPSPAPPASIRTASRPMACMIWPATSTSGPAPCTGLIPTTLATAARTRCRWPASHARRVLVCRANICALCVSATGSYPRYRDYNLGLRLARSLS